MSQHLNMYSQHGCMGCKPCEGGGANIGRAALIWCTFGLFTFGIALLFFKKCQYCGHNSFMNKHSTPAQQAAPAAQPVVHITQTFQGGEAPTNTPS